MGHNQWVLLLAGVLLGGGGIGGLVSAWFARQRDRAAEKATDVQVGLAVLKEAIAELRADKADQAAEIKDLKAQIAKGGRPR